MCVAAARGASLSSGCVFSIFTVDCNSLATATSTPSDHTTAAGTDEGVNPAPPPDAESGSSSQPRVKVVRLADLEANVDSLVAKPLGKSLGSEVNPAPQGER